MTASFLVLDLETANAAFSSVCQYGLVTVGPKGITDRRSALIDPRSHFTSTRIHGIARRHVRGCPPFQHVYPELRKRLSGQIVVAHSTFERKALAACVRAFQLPAIDCTWIDSIRIAQDAWPELAGEGHGLRRLTDYLRIPLTQHDALSDAVATAEIVILAMEKTGLPVTHWIGKGARKFKGPGASLRLAKSFPGWTPPAPDEGGVLPFAGRGLAFSGVFQVPADLLAAAAKAAGFLVQKEIDNRTRVLCVPASSEVEATTRTAKQVQAEHLAALGQDIRIITDKDLLTLIGARDGRPLVESVHVTSSNL
jgi:DNA polymerase-3 subunit epsilon